MSIHGTFYFTKTKSGNLLGEFINNGLKNFRAVKIFSYISENKKGYGIIQRRKYYRFF